MQTVNIKTIKPIHTRCPKCGGRIAIEADTYGAFENCICCGFTFDLPDPNIKPPVDFSKLKD